jgi:hypothetical protein
MKSTSSWAFADNLSPAMGAFPERGKDDLERAYKNGGFRGGA